MKNLIIYGAGDFGRVTAWYIEEINKISPEYNLLGFIDDGDIREKTIAGYPFLGGKEYFEAHKEEVCCIVSVCIPNIAEKIVKFLDSLGFVDYPIIVFPGNIISPHSVIGKGSVIGPMVTIDRDVYLGNHVKVCQNSSINHNDNLGDFSIISPGVSLAGHVKIGKGTMVGIGASVLPCLSIGENSVIGAGAVVVSNIPDNTTVMGVPAKPKQ